MNSQDFKIGDRVKRVRDTTGFNYGDYIDHPGTVVANNRLNTVGQPLIDVKLDGDMYPSYESSCFYPDELEHL